jgi:hypothetical protein
MLRTNSRTSSKTLLDFSQFAAAEKENNYALASDLYKKLNASKIRRYLSFSNCKSWRISINLY